MKATGEILVKDSTAISMPRQRAYPCGLSRLVEDESGQDLIEYALVAATIGLGTVAGVNGLASSISRYMSIVLLGFDTALAGH